MKKYLLFLGLLIFFLSACEQATNRPKRPQDPWIIRSVLDSRPRMLTLALHSEGYAAYDTEKCGLYKIWRGGIHLDGAAYNNIKTVQPGSWGTTYWEDPLQEPIWFVEQKNEKQAVQAQFKGYRLRKDQITFTYELALADGQKIKVYEKPVLIPEKNGQIRYVRSFRTENVPAGSLVYYKDYRFREKGETEIAFSFEAVPIPEKTAGIPAGSKSKYWLERSGCNTCHEENEKTIGPSYRQIAARYPRNTENIRKLVKKVRQGGAGVWGEAIMNPHPHLSSDDLDEMVKYILSLQPASKEAKPSKKNKSLALSSEELKAPGFGRPLEGLHPSLDLYTIRPDWFRPRVGAMDFLSDGRLLVSTWDTLGAVYLLSGLESGDTSQVNVKRIAAGLAEPLGLKVVDDEIFVLQKQELTQLIDHDGDELIDEYKTICNSFGATIDFHEFSYGLEYKDGYFYANLGLAMRLMAHESQHSDRGASIKISRDGKFSIVADGLRQPNGIGFGLDEELFVTENQGQWVPANKLIHLRAGDFHGCQYGTGDKYAGREMTPPAVWLPQDEIGNSPSQPVLIPTGPYQGQMLHGEVTHGGLKRVFMEKINDAYQGCVFRFTQGLEAGVNRLAWGPENKLYAGGIGMVGNWGWKGRQYGLQALKFNDKITFEMLAVRAKADGIEIEFTEPLAQSQGLEVKDYLIQQWRYEPTPAYGGPKLDLQELPIREIKISPDRKKVRLQIKGCKEKHVLYLQLSNDLRSESGQKLWTGDCWYTLNAIPRPKAGDALQ